MASLMVVTICYIVTIFLSTMHSVKARREEIIKWFRYRIIDRKIQDEA